MCQQESQKEDKQRCQKECQKRCQKECNVRRYASKNVRRCAKNVRRNVRRDCCRMLPVFLKHLCKQLWGGGDEPDIESNNNINNPHLTDSHRGWCQRLCFNRSRLGPLEVKNFFNACGFQGVSFLQPFWRSKSKQGSHWKSSFWWIWVSKMTVFCRKLGASQKTFHSGMSQCFTRGSFGSNRFD